MLEPDLTPDNVIIVGDTPNDILCAQAIKARSLIILAGSTYNTEELKSYNPWQIILNCLMTPGILQLYLTKTNMYFKEITMKNLFYGLLLTLLFTTTPAAAYNSSDLNQLMSSGSCAYGDLSGADLSTWILPEQISPAVI